MTAMYISLSTDKTTKAKPLSQALSSMNFSKPIGSLYICGHSLGAAVATLLALDIAHNNKDFPEPIVYTFASPRVGGFLFAHIYNQSIQQNYRIFNPHDLVPKLPLPWPFLPYYVHVKGGFILNQTNLEPNPIYQHSMSTYMNLLDKVNGVIIESTGSVD